MEANKELPQLPGCLADRLYEAISIAYGRAEHAGSTPRMRKWNDTAADLRAALATQAAPQEVPDRAAQAKQAAMTSYALAAQVNDLSALTRRLLHALNHASPGNAIAKAAANYLVRHGLQGSPLRAEDVLRDESAPAPAVAVDAPDEWEGPWQLQIDSCMTDKEEVRAYITGKEVKLEYTDGSDRWALKLPVPTARSKKLTLAAQPAQAPAGELVSTACSSCYGSGTDVAGNPCPCGCLVRVLATPALNAGQAQSAAFTEADFRMLHSIAHYFSTTDDSPRCGADLQNLAERIRAAIAAQQPAQQPAQADDTRDAARYRWLRHGDNDELLIQKGPVDSTYHWLPRKERLDAMIDAAIAAQKGGAG